MMRLDDWHNVLKFTSPAVVINRYISSWATMRLPQGPTYNKPFLLCLRSLICIPHHMINTKLKTRKARVFKKQLFASHSTLDACAVTPPTIPRCKCSMFHINITLQAIRWNLRHLDVHRSNGHPCNGVKRRAPLRWFQSDASVLTFLRLIGFCLRVR